MKKIQLLYFAIFTLAVSCGLSAQKYFKIIDATATAWAGGIPQNGSGITYKVMAVLLTSQRVTFNQIWIGKEYGLPEAISFSYADSRQLTRGDTVIVQYTDHHYPEGSTLAAIPKPKYKNPPVPVKGDALLGFMVGKTTRYRTVVKFRTLPAVNHP
jgi:hypothetical protein